MILKSFLLVLYFWYQLYCEKGYLSFAHTQGISRLQLQHPVDHCNPLTDDPAGCKTNFKKLEALPYCTQSPAKDDIQIHREDCEYFDEYDIKFGSGFQTTNLFIPTKRTIYSQNVACGMAAHDPCPVVDKFTVEKNTYFADIEDFTLLIDHSMVNDELKMSATAFDMIGFYNPCGRGKELEAPSISPQAVEEATKQSFLSSEQKDKLIKEERKEELCTFMPIHRPGGIAGTTEEKFKKERGFAMWKEPWYHTIFPVGPFGGDSHKMAYADQADFVKIKNGDVIKIADILKLIGPQASLDNPETNNRLDGMVIIIDIQYSNWKEYTWPNHVAPAYFYSFSLAPANEYKVMLDQTRQVVTDRYQNKRILYDYHGIFIIIKQHGDIGVASWSHILLLILGALIIESMYRAIFTLCILNFPQIVHSDEITEEEVEEEEERLEKLICKDYKIGSEDPEGLHGGSKVGASDSADSQRGLLRCRQ